VTTIKYVVYIRKYTELLRIKASNLRINTYKYAKKSSSMNGYCC